MKIVLVGIGAMGKKYCKMIADNEVEGMELVGVVCRNEDAKAYVLSCKESLKIYNNVDEMLADEASYDSVLICTPHKTHAEIAIKAFELGKNVMCDKPAGASITDAISMEKAANKSGKIYAMMFHQRCYDKHRKLKELVDNKELGDIQRIILLNSRFLRTKYYHSSGAWRSSWEGEGGGALINQGQHILDMWQWIFGMPESLYAEIPFGKYNDFKVDDEATILMRYKGNVTATFMLTTGEAIWQERLEVIGTKGKVILEDNTMRIYRYSEDSKEYINTATTNSREGLTYTEEVVEFEKKPEPYVEMLLNFVNAVNAQDETILIANGKDSINPLMLTNGAYYSARKGVRIDLPLDSDEYDKLLEELISEE